MKHGSPVAYVEHKCRCDECKEGNRVRAAQRRRLKAYGQYQSAYVDVAPVRAHVRELTKRGWGVKKIAAKAGISVTIVRHVVYGRSPAEAKKAFATPRPKRTKKIFRKNAEALLAVQYSLEESTGGTLVPSVGARRRAQTLVYQGYSFGWQAKQLGISPSNYLNMLERDRIHADTWHKIANLYDTHVWTKNTAKNRHEQSALTRCANIAARLGFKSPYAWDNIDSQKD